MRGGAGFEASGSGEQSLNRGAGRPPVLSRFFGFLAYPMGCTTAAGFVLLGIGIFASQVLGWLQAGEWTPMEAIETFPEELAVRFIQHVEGMEWRGVAKVIRWTFTQSAAWFWVFVGFAFVWLTTWLDDLSRSLGSTRESKSTD